MLHPFGIWSRTRQELTTAEEDGRGAATGPGPELPLTQNAVTEVTRSSRRSWDRFTGDDAFTWTWALLLLTGKTMWPQAPAPYHPPSESLKFLLAPCFHWIGEINGWPPQFCFHFLQWKTMTCHCDIDWRESRRQLFYYQVFAACPSLSRCGRFSFTCVARRQAARRLASNLWRKQCCPSAHYRRHHNQPKSNINKVFMTAIRVIKGSPSVTSKMLIKPIRYTHIQILCFYDMSCNHNAIWLLLLLNQLPLSLDAVWSHRPCLSPVSHCP